MDPKADAGRLVKKLALFVLFFAILMEILLRLYDPFHFRVKGDKVVLPVNQREIIDNRINPKLDPIVINTRNSLGFRGPEPSKDTVGQLRIVTMGGSAVECHFLNDDKTWPFLLGKHLAGQFPDCWLNNAGMDGHSTYGHVVLLNGFVKELRPSMVIFLTGINDVENSAPTFHDKLNTRGAVADWRHYLFDNSEVLSLLLNLSRGWRVQRFTNTTNSMLLLDPVQRKRLPDSVVRERMSRQAPFLEGYRSRLKDLADTCIAWHILPVFLTQPNQFGAGRDSVTGADLALFPVDGMGSNMNGKLVWDLLEQYNDVTRSLCRDRGLPLIDLALLMPKNSLYFYDMSHFTNEGSEELCRIIEGPLDKIIRENLSCIRK